MTESVLLTNRNSNFTFFFTFDLRHFPSLRYSNFFLKKKVNIDNHWQTICPYGFLTFAVLTISNFFIRKMGWGRVSIISYSISFIKQNLFSSNVSLVDLTKWPIILSFCPSLSLKNNWNLQFENERFLTMSRSLGSVLLSFLIPLTWE